MLSPGPSSDAPCYLPAVPERRRHRGPDPEDAASFGPDALPRLRAATHDASWLLSRGYSSKAVGTLTGDRYQLTERQRRAVMRCAAGEEAVARRLARQRALEAAGGRTLAVDGFNVLLTVEAALAGGVLLLGRDGCLRDMASMHGRFLETEETEAALVAVGRTLAAAPPASVWWLFDAPVSHSGRLAAQVEALAAAHGWPWRAETVPNPDPVLKGEPLVATADGAILEVAEAWVNLARITVERSRISPWVLNLDGAPAAHTDGGHG